MCFSHANRLPFRLTCIAGGVQRSCLCQRDVFDWLISRVMFPSTSFWGKPWRFGALIAFSASSVLFQVLLFASWTYILMPFLAKKIASCSSFFKIPGSSEKLEMRGIEARTSRMLSERSTIWAKSPLRKRGPNAISNLSSVNAIVEQSSFAYRCKIGYVDAGCQSMCFTYANRLPFRLRFLTGCVQRSHFFHREVFDSLVSRLMFPSTSFWGKPWRFGVLIACSASSVLFQMLPFAYWTYISSSFFDLTE